MPKQPYDENPLFDPGDLLDRIERWANDPYPSHRLLSIVGPPGVGKSRLMAAARKRLEKNNHLVFCVDFSREGNTFDKNQPKQDLTTPSGRSQWLKDRVTEAQKKCRAVRVFDSSVSFEAMLDSLVEDLCRRCQLSLPPVLLVDGFEAVLDERQQGWLEEQFLARFLARSCTRIMISMGEESFLRHATLRWAECRMPPEP